jgi:CBS domain-containing protein
MKIREVYQRPVVTLCTNARLSEAYSLLRDPNVEAVVVIASQVPNPTVVGVLFLRDIHVTHADQEQLGELTVLDRLTGKAFIVGEDDDVQSVADQMERRHVSYAPVVGVGGTLLGGVSLPKLLRLAGREHHEDNDVAKVRTVL